MVEVVGDLVTGAGVVLGLETAWPNWFTTKDLILSGVTGAAVVVLGRGRTVVVVVGRAVVVGCLVVVGAAVVVVAGVVVVVVVVVIVVVVAVVVGVVVVVVLAVVVVEAVVVPVVVVLAVVVRGLAVVWLTLAGRTTELALLAPLDLEDSTEGGFSVRIWTNLTSSGFSSGRAFFSGWCSFLVGRKKVSENLSAVRAGAAGWAGSLTGAGLMAPNL